MTSEQRDWVPDTPEGVSAFMDGLTFDFDRPVSEDQVPPVLAEGEDVMVPRSFKIPVGLDADLQAISDAHGVSKSELIRRYLTAGVAAERASQGEDVLVPMSEVLRALSQLRGLPRSA